MQDSTGTPLFSARLTPHRSLGGRGRWVVVGFAAALGAIPALGSLALGAWPIAIFVGLDVLAIGWALHLSNRHGKAAELVTLWSDRLRIVQISASGTTRQHQFNPAFVRLVIERDYDEHTRTLCLRSADGDFEIGALLSPDEKSGFAKVFGTALRKARISSVKTGS